jgi:ketosteroid isomerase-like protein
MSDHEAIRRLLAEYCFATDAGATERWVSCFTDDVVWDGGAFGRFEGKPAARAYHRAAGDAITRFRHITTNLLIELNDDQAEVRSYVQVYDRSGETPKIMFFGFYDDCLRKEDGRWRIARRRLTAEPSVDAG